MAQLIVAGNATPSQVLTGNTFSAGSQTGVSGTMSNNGAVALTPSASSQAIAAGYHNGSGSVAAVTFTAANVLTGTTIAGTAGTMVNRGATNFTPSTVNQTILAGYHNGSGVVSGDANLVASKILIGQTIFGVAGTGGKRYATGSTVSADSTIGFNAYNGVTHNRSWITVSGLAFLPKVINWFGAGNAMAFYNGYSTALSGYSTPIAFPGGSTWYQLTGGASVTNGSFSMPVESLNASYTWWAWE